MVQRVHPGSSGTLIVAANRAALFTDSRYWEQAEAELSDTPVDLFQAGRPCHSSPMCIGCACKASAGQLAVDGAVLGLAQTQQLQQAPSPPNGPW